MIVVERARQTLCQFALSMVIDIDQRRDTCTPVRAIAFSLAGANPCSGEVTDCLRAVLVPARGNGAIERRDQFVVEG